MKNKGDVRFCSNYSRANEPHDKDLEEGSPVKIRGFNPRKTTADSLCFENTDGKVQEDLYCVCVDLEKVHDRVLREALWYRMKKSEMAEVC